MVKNIVKTLPLLAVAALLATGCSSFGKDYGGVDELVKAWEDFSGETCQDRDFGDGHATCNPATMLSVYQDFEAVDARLEEMEDHYSGSEYDREVLVGPNWIAKVDEDELEDLSDEIGGEIIRVGGR
jgi:hypothetical protein